MFTNKGSLHREMRTSFFVSAKQMDFIGIKIHQILFERKINSNNLLFYKVIEETALFCFIKHKYFFCIFHNNF